MKLGLSLIGIIMLLLLWTVQNVPTWVEFFYSRGFYPGYSYLPKILFGWVPFSVGDLFYAVLFLLVLGIPVRIVIALIRRQWRKARQHLWNGLILILGLYLFFHAAWALNYYRVPLKDQLGLSTDTVLLDDHLLVLEQHIEQANRLREQIDWTGYSRQRATEQVERLMRSDSYSGLLSQTQVRVKAPILGPWVSYFGVAGYFNPFTGEAHVNMDMPLASLPFTLAHEIAHQMGLGLEDECNFMAFIRLQDHRDARLAYSAYFQSVNYLLRSLYLIDVNRFEAYRDRLSTKVQRDMRTEQMYWQQYTGWINDGASLFYNQYLKHNNQLEGMARYGMVSRLIIAWEKKNRQAQSLPWNKYSVE
ncbi:MAG: DUF3810 domain-containing protein [Sphingobacterium sp.]